MKHTITISLDDDSFAIWEALPASINKSGLVQDLLSKQKELPKMVKELEEFMEKNKEKITNVIYEILQTNLKIMRTYLGFYSWF